jgi:6-phosphofructokinase 1
MRIGVLTGGGDCPGLNAVIRAVVRKGVQEYGYDFVGFRDGWRGPLEGDTVHLDIPAVRGILPRGGTILGSSRTNPLQQENGIRRIKDNLAKEEIDALVAIGGEDTLGVAARLADEYGIQVVGVPKTIDNDLSATDYTFGFDTAVNIAMEAIDRLHTTAESHKRILILEVMGRHAGWIAFYSGIAGGADAILVPERPFDVEELCAHLERRFALGRHFGIVVVSEGAMPVGGDIEAMGGQVDEFGHARLGGVGQRLEAEIEQRTGYETRTTVLGHIQRGGTPTAFDRVLATRLGIAAMEAAHEGQWGTMASLKAMQIEMVQLTDAVRELRTLGEAELHVIDSLVA